MGPWRWRLKKIGPLPSSSNHRISVSAQSCRIINKFAANLISTLLTLLGAKFYSRGLLSKGAAGPAAYLLSTLLEGSKSFLFAAYLKSKLQGQQRT